MRSGVGCVAATPPRLASLADPPPAGEGDTRPWRPSMPDPRWPELPYAAWKDTAATLQLWTQIAGKVRLAATPWLNHSWHVTLRVTTRGLVTPLIATAERDFQIEFDFLDHTLWIRTADGQFRQVMLRPVS